MQNEQKSAAGSIQKMKREVLSRLEKSGKRMIIRNVRPIEKKRDRVRENALNSHSARRNTRAARQRAESLRCCSASKGENLFPSIVCRQEETTEDYPYFVI